MSNYSALADKLCFPIATDTNVSYLVRSWRQRNGANWKVYAFDPDSLPAWLLKDVCADIITPAVTDVNNFSKDIATLPKTHNIEDLHKE